MKRLVIIVAGMLVVATFGRRFYQATHPEAVESIADVQAREGIPVEVAVARKSDVEIWRAYCGTVEGIEQTAVVSNVSEEALEVLARVGDRVKAGDVLVRLARRKSQVGYKQNLASCENIRKEAARLEALYAEGAVSEQVLDQARTQLRVAQANLDAAVAYLDLTSPIDGVVVARDLEAGDHVLSGKAVMTVAELSRAIVKVNVSAWDARLAREGMTARLAADEDPEQRPGTVRRVALSADPESRLVEVELEFGNADGLLIPGTLATAEVLLREARGTTVIPKRAVQQNGSDTAAWVVGGDGTAEYRPLRLGLVNATVVQVLDGVNEGDQVVVTGANLLEPGRKAKVVARSREEG